jgi:hypothetical protein
MNYPKGGEPMVRVLIVMCALVMVLSALPAYCQDAAVPEDMPAVAAEAPEMPVAMPDPIPGTVTPSQAAVTGVSGEAIAVNAEEGTLVIKVVKDQITKEAEEMTFQLAPTSAVSKGGSQAALSDIQVGDTVNIAYSTDASGSVKVLGVMVP